MNRISFLGAAAIKMVENKVVGRIPFFLLKVLADGVEDWPKRGNTAQSIMRKALVLHIATPSTTVSSIRSLKAAGAIEILPQRPIIIHAPKVGASPAEIMFIGNVIDKKERPTPETVKLFRWFFSEIDLSKLDDIPPIRELVKASGFSYAFVHKNLSWMRANIDELV